MTGPEQPRTEEPATSLPADPAAGGRGDAWRRLARIGRPRWTRANLLVAVLAAALGVALVVQIQSTQRQGLSTMRESDLVNLLGDVSQRSTRLDGQISELQRQRDALATGGTGADAALSPAQTRLDDLRILAGTVPATGPGVVLTVTDPSGGFGATQVLNAVEELRDAGAEAIDVGGVRVVASSSVTGTGADVSVDGTAIRRPLVVTAIGDPQTLGAAMQIPGGVTDTVRRAGGTAVVDQRQSVTIGSLAPSPSPRYAQPVTTPTPASPSPSK